MTRVKNPHPNLIKVQAILRTRREMEGWNSNEGCEILSCYD